MTTDESKTLQLETLTVGNITIQMETLESVEREYILKVLAATGFNKTKAAKILDINVRTIDRKLKEWNVRS